MPSPLFDLDELTLKCRDRNSRSYISEAVASYRAGAIRASIVSTWIAVCFDVIEKLRELALSGDKAAELIIEDLEKTRKAGDIAKALKFERELLILCRDKFEILSPLEFIDLDRLQADRNRCAHPSLISEEQAYSPSAELARAHLAAAVNHLLQHPPAQGRYALDRLIQEISSEYFPTDATKAITALSTGPLRRPRDSLIRNFAILLVKRLISDESGKARSRTIAALRALRTLHPAQTNATLQEKLNTLFRTLQDKELSRASYFLQHIADCWQYIDPDIRLRIQAYVRDLPASDLESLEFLAKYDPLKEAANARASRITRTEFKDLMFWDLPPVVAERMIEVFLASQNFDQANELAKQLSVHDSDLSRDNVLKILRSAHKNEQVLYCFELGALLADLRKREVIPDVEFERELNANGLGRYASASPQKA